MLMPENDGCTPCMVSRDEETGERVFRKDAFFTDAQNGESFILENGKRIACRICVKYGWKRYRWKNWRIRCFVEWWGAPCCSLHEGYFPSFLLFANRSSANSEIPLEVFTISVRFNLRQRLTGIREGRSFFSLHEWEKWHRYGKHVVCSWCDPDRCPILRSRGLERKLSRRFLDDVEIVSARFTYQLSNIRLTK